MTICPIHGGECQDDEACDTCLNFMNTCDRCLTAGHQDSAGWREGKDGETLCMSCFGDQSQNVGVKE